MTLSDGFPPFYAERTTSFFYDISLTYLIFAAVALFLAILLILPGIRGIDRLYFLLRWTLSLFVGVSILACVNGFGWQTSIIETYLPSRGQRQILSKFEIGLHVGLTTFNITLKELEEGNFNINYNEQFSYRDSDTQLTNALSRGLPTPIVNIAEYFTFNRVTTMWLWGRRYWISGYYATYMLWAAFAFWVLGNILFETFIKYGAFNRILVGLLMLAANISFANVNSFCCLLEIHFGYQEPAVLKPVYGWSFWLCLIVGIITFIEGVVLLSATYYCSEIVHRFFNLEKKEEVTFFEAEQEEALSPPRSRATSKLTPVSLDPNAVLEDTDNQQEKPSYSRKNSLKKMTFIQMGDVENSSPTVDDTKTTEDDKKSKGLEQFGSETV